MNKSKVCFWMLMGVICLPALLMAETIVFKDGKRIQVDQVWEEGNFIKCIRFGGEVSYPKSKVERIEGMGTQSEAAPQTVSRTAAKTVSPGSSRTSSPAPSRTKAYDSASPPAASGSKINAGVPGGKVPPEVLEAIQKMERAEKQQGDRKYLKHNIECSNFPKVKVPDFLDIPVGSPAPDAIQTGVEKHESGIFKAAYEGDLAQVKGFVQNDRTAIRQINSFGETPLHIAATMCHVDMVKFLLEKGADANAGSHWGYTPLMGAALVTEKMKNMKSNPRGYYGWDIIPFQDRDFKSVIPMLLSHGADINAVKHGFDPCTCSANVSDWEMCRDRCHPSRHSILRREPNGTAFMMTSDKNMYEYLIKHGANVNAQDREGNTKFHLICAGLDKRFKKECEEKLKYWLGLGADPNIMNAKGQTPYEYGASKGRRALLESAIKNIGVPAPLIRYQFEEAVWEIEAGGSQASAWPSLTHWPNCSSDSGFESTTKLREMLQQNPSFVHETSDHYQTLLHYAASDNHIGAVELLLDLGADPNAVDSWGQTPMHKVEVADSAILLLKYGADPTILNCSGDKAMRHCKIDPLKVAKMYENIPNLEAEIAVKAKERGPVQQP